MLNLIPYKIVITYPNMDEGSEIIHEALENFQGIMRIKFHIFQI